MKYPVKTVFLSVAVRWQQLCIPPPLRCVRPVTQNETMPLYSYWLLGTDLIMNKV